MDQSAFYAIVSAVNFTLLGLWWVAAKDRPNVAGTRTAYLVGMSRVATKAEGSPAAA